MRKGRKLHIFDTKTRQKEVLTPEKGETIRMYTCGPTIYNFPHIGNLRTYVFEDLLCRTIRFFGMDVYQVMNLTDVDDKTIRGAIASKLPLLESVKPYKEAFFEDLKSLMIEPARVYPAATDHIPQMIQMIETLIAKKIAYVGQDGNVFYRISAFPNYGKLSHLNLADLKVGASERVEADEYDKENVSDFVLWKAYDAERDGTIYWDSPWGKGRPGWHIECSAMAMHYLGETIDLHVGGVDNIFPHHENEIAQSEGCTGKVFARHWMHANHLIVEGKKMSKSLGNFYTLRDLLKEGYTGREVRYLLMSTHYRASLNFTFESLKGAREALRRMDDFQERIERLTGKGISVQKEITAYREAFSLALGDDLNIAEALAAIFECIRKMNTLYDEGILGAVAKEEIEAFIKETDGVLAIWQKKKEELPLHVIELARKRREARDQREWALADKLRKELTDLGYKVEDTEDSFVVKKI